MSNKVGVEREVLQRWAHDMRLVSPIGPELRKLLADNPNSWACWSCKVPVTMAQRADADGDCPHCKAELDIELWPFPDQSAKVGEQSVPESSEASALQVALTAMTHDRDYCKRVATHNKEVGESTQQRLAASEQRNAELVELLRNASDKLPLLSDTALWARIVAVINPSENPVAPVVERQQPAIVGYMQDRTDGEPLITLESHQGYVKHLEVTIEQQLNVLKSLRAELTESYAIDTSPQAPASLDEINQLAFEHGQPADNGDGYLFSQEQFDAFATVVLAAPVAVPVVERNIEPSLWCVRVPDEPENPEESPAEYFYPNSRHELNKLLKNPGATVVERYFGEQPAPVAADANHTESGASE